MGRIAAIAGGDLISTEPLNKYALGMTGKDRPNVLFVPTADRDDPAYIKAFTEAFEKLGATVRTLEIVRKSNTDREIDNLFDWMDMVYVGGGNTIYMMNKWREFGIDTRLKTVFSNDSAVLSGNGAGCACWFTCGYSNSEFYGGKTDWQYIWADDLLDFHHTAICPHYNDEGRSNFDKRLIEKEIPGYALEDNVALIQQDYHTEIIASHPKAKAYYLVYLNGRMMKQEIDLKFVLNTED